MAMSNFWLMEQLDILKDKIAVKSDEDEEIRQWLNDTYPVPNTENLHLNDLIKAIITAMFVEVGKSKIKMQKRKKPKRNWFKRKKK